MNVLIISPHADDEVLGCGGLISRRIADGHSVDTVVVSISDVMQAGNTLKSTAKNRTAELEEAARRMGTNPPEVLFKGYENELDQLPMLRLITALDEVLGRKQYNEVLLPYPSHHQDHRIVYEAGYSALRVKGPKTPSLVALYEYPYIAWTPTAFSGGRHYVDISDCLENKLQALSAYASQVQPAPHPTSMEAVRTLAAMRGMECGRRYAELFYILRSIE